MGCDGGSIPRRDELVKMKKAAPVIDESQLDRLKCRNCQISTEPLQDPIVICKLGMLYNKDSVIRALLDKSMPKKCSHIKGLKDIKEIHFTPNPDFNLLESSEQNQELKSISKSPFICPITLTEFSVKHPFAVLSCGCVLSQQCLKDFVTDTNICLNCNKKFTSTQNINPGEEELNEIKRQISELKANASTSKKEKIKKRKRTDETQQERKKRKLKAKENEKARIKDEKKKKIAIEEKEKQKNHVYDSIFISKEQKKLDSILTITTNDFAAAKGSMLSTIAKMEA